MARLFLLCAMAVLPAHAVIVGDSPDAPQRLVDPNVPQSPWAGVGSMVVNGNAYGGVLIGRQHVLTAAHVVAGAKLSRMEFHLNADGDSSSRIGVTAVHVHPGYRGFGSGGVAFDDLAVVELASPAPDTVPVYPMLSQVPPPGTRLTFVGYGAAGDGVRG